MSGHSKWSTIKRKKEKEDAKRGKIFTKLIKEITVAARQGGGDPEANPTLRTAIQNAKASNMPQTNIDRAIKKGTGELPGAVYEQVTYEGYGPQGVALLIESLTDNKNRTVSDIRHILSKHNGHLGETGSVAWMFDQKGVISVEEANEDELLALALEAGAEDMRSEDSSYEIIIPPEKLQAVKKKLEEQFLIICYIVGWGKFQFIKMVDFKKLEVLLTEKNIQDFLIHLGKVRFIILDIQNQ